ncbi:unnamed protein product [Photorhabdus laumondii subsp. laumondii TTO1]|uniref:Photorhabdus luminescens subsp. laumondii TTO1 complete genome segment 4/17 n=1 Tax=Photorhabdus laumondii subsp. laumondii (strain DSM 15139 / CIP 105565 / TT01) TaxID=243265 RepID=Q7N817_PHOLL|nr:unnamed protein product [Photorhabdus laumondii subsp. laumondii TTO1]
MLLSMITPLALAFGTTAFATQELERVYDDNNDVLSITSLLKAPDMLNLFSNNLFPINFSL